MVWTLAIETTGTGGSVALLRDDLLAAELRLDPAERSAVTLAPSIDRLLREQSLAPSDLGLIGVLVGPGSFTGLRIGLATAKTMAYALQIPLCGVETLDALAHAAPPPAADHAPHSRLHCVVDAQRGEWFHAVFEADAPNGLSSTKGGWRRASPTQIRSREAVVADLAPGDLLCGPALFSGNRPGVASQLPPAQLTPPAAWAPQAAACGQLACAAWRSGRADDPFTLAPLYFRPSYAEEKRPS